MKTQHTLEHTEPRYLLLFQEAIERSTAESSHKVVLADPERQFFPEAIFKLGCQDVQHVEAYPHERCPHLWLVYGWSGKIQIEQRLLLLVSGLRRCKGSDPEPLQGRHLFDGDHTNFVVHLSMRYNLCNRSASVVIEEVGPFRFGGDCFTCQANLFDTESIVDHSLEMVLWMRQRVLATRAIDQVAHTAKVGRSKPELQPAP